MMDKKYIQADAFIDCEQEQIANYAKHLAHRKGNRPADIAVKLYNAVRDQIIYDPYAISKEPVDYRASNILAKRRGFCVQKAILLCALARSAGIPSRLGFATVRNHLASRKLLHFIGAPVFVFHGYTELWLDDRWIKVTPAFNAGLCGIYNVQPLEFDGSEHALFQSYNSFQKPFMEYIQYHGSFSTVPLTEMLTAWEDFYGTGRVRTWFDAKDTAPFKNRGEYSLEKPFTPE
jgi:transglutaminase-like putative cysteine protease